jgi:YidC/Oxa1 family membrane protein insertase
MDNRRLILLLVFSFSLIMLWEGWQRHNAPVPVTPPTAAAPVTSGAPGVVPTPTFSAPGSAAGAAVPGNSVLPAPGVASAKISTDLYVVDISAQGGDITRLELVRHPATENKAKNFLLFDSGERHIYLAQSGLIGEGLPNHKSEWKLAAGDQVLKDGENQLVVRLEATAAGGGKVVKTYTFHRGSYQIDVSHEGVPAGTPAYYQITRDGKPAEAQAGSSMMMGVTTFTGPAVYTDTEKYQKVEFADIVKEKAKFAHKSESGWLAMVQHYFVTAWLPPAGVAREFYMRKVGDDLFSAGVILPVAADGKSSLSLYAGPQDQDKLEKIAPGLELVVDYGWLGPIAVPLFWVLAAIHKLVGNWGWSIIGLTVLLKLLFFPLSAASYKSMAKMRVLTPKLAKLKETYGDDKQRLNVEMMGLYKREKVNPLGGCLPVLVQIPVFISLYWMLLGTVEMRNAPWLGWITDLSVKDPYYVLPLIMGATMFIQTKLNPTPPDPIQAKIMLFLPIMFTGMFLFFPSGLVLYWTVNNVLSIAQQWQITRAVEAGLKK